MKSLLQRMTGKIRKRNFQKRTRLGLRKLLHETLESREVFAAFTPGNLAVLQAAASANSTTAAVLEVNPQLTSQTSAVQTIGISSSGTDAIRISGSATSTGYVSRTNDGSSLVFTGHNTTNASVNANTITTRAAVALNASGTVSIAAAYTGTSGNQTRSATSLDNSSWYIADQGGLYTNGSSSASPTGNFRGIKAFGGTVFVGQASGTATNIQIGTMSAPTGGSFSGLPGLTNNANLQDFYMIQSGENGSVYDVLYVVSATSNSAGTFAKYSRLAGTDAVFGTADDTWTANGTASTTFGGFGLAAIDNGTSAGATLYVTTGQGAAVANSINKLVDSADYNATMSLSASTTVFTTATGTILKGLDFVPVSGSNNTPPTISDIPNQTTDEDTSTGNINFTVSDAETSVNSLIVTAISSNTTLVPSGNITLGGSGANRTISILPAANLSGTSVISVSVSDGTNVTTDTFTLTVNPVNDAPTIQDVSDQATALNTLKSVSFTIGDIDSDINSLTVTGLSDNQTLLPNANISFSGTGANRTVTLTPASNQSGTATITLTVSDGSLTASDTFVLTVTANNPPTISDIPNQTILEDTNTGDVAFTVGDSETAASSLVVSAVSSDTVLVPNTNILLSGTGANRTIRVTPVANGFGVTTITVSVSDGISTTSDTFDVIVTSVNDAPTITSISNQAILKNRSTPALAFTIGDIEGDTLSVTGSSSNQSLVPNANIVISGTGNSRTVVVTPIQDAVGLATITLTVSDGQDSSFTSFDLSVTELPAIYISEIMFNPTGTDAPNEFVELRGTPNSTIPTGTYLLGIEGDTGAAAGDVQTIFDLSGKTFNDAGYMVFLQSGNNYGVSAGPGIYTATGTGFGGLAGFSADSNGTDIENSSVSFLIVSASVAPTLTNDIDSDNNGIADGAVYADWLVLDGVAIVDAATDTSYAPVTFAVNGTAATSPTSVIIDTGANTANYVARVGESTGATASDWVGGGLTDLIAVAPMAWAFNRLQTFPSSLAGARIDSLGSANLFTPSGVSLAISDGTTQVTEGGNTDSYTLQLDTKPVSNVVITVTPDSQLDLGNGAGIAISLTFTPANWNVPQAVTVTAFDDTLFEGPHTGTISHTIATSGLDYAGLTLPSVSVDITDNDSSSGITITVTSGNRSYDGTPYAATADITGFVGPQPTLTFVYYADAAGTTTISSPVNVGDYFVRAISSADAFNSAAQSAISPFSILKKTITATASVTTKTYDGSSVATIVYSSVLGLVGTETLVITGSGLFNDPNAFTGKPVTADAPQLANGSNGGLASNYSLATPTGLSGNINRRVLTATATAQNKVYDKTTSTTVVYSALGNLVGTETVVITGTGVFEDFNVGTSIPVTANAPVLANGLNGGLASNYTVATPTNLSASITPKQITVTGITGNNKVYNASAAASVTGTPVLSGLISGDGVSLVGTPTYVFNNKNVGISKPISVTGFNIFGFSAGNYTLQQPQSLTGTISAASLTVTGLSAISRVYDATSNATVSGTATLSGVFSGDTVSLSGTGSYQFNNKNVGTGKPISTSGFTINGTDSGNYLLTQPSLTANITQATATIQGLTGNNKVYDASTIASASGTATLNGIISGDSVQLTGTPSYNFVNKTVGTSKSIITTGFTVSGTDGANYALTQPVLAAEISPATLSVTGLTGNNKVYDRSTVASASGTASLAGILGSDSVTLVGIPSLQFGDANVGNLKPISVSGYSLGSGDAGNYVLQELTLAANITPRSLQIVADNKSKLEGQSDPVLTFSTTGLLSGDNSTGSLTRQAGESVGTYAILQGDLSFGINYDVTFIPAVFTIHANAPTVVSSTLNQGAGFLNQSQRSQIVSIVVSFSAPVSIASNAFTLENVGLITASSTFVPQSQLIVTPSGDSRSVTITFASGAGVVSRVGGAGTTANSNSLADGNYVLKVDPTKVTVSGTPMAGTSPTTVAVDNFFRMYGDSNGDGLVSATDTTAFRNALTTYNAAFDWNGDGLVTNGGNDRDQYLANFGKKRRTI